jgi:hypothetical protein
MATKKKALDWALAPGSTGYYPWVHSLVKRLSSIKWLGVIFILPAIPMQGQDHIFLDFDSVPNCEIMKDGTFLSIDHPRTDFYMVVKDGVQTEYVQDGKYFVRSRMEWISDCSYRSYVFEVTIPDYNVQLGESATTVILSTLCDEYVKYKAQMKGKELVSVLHKQNTPPCP